MRHVDTHFDLKWMTSPKGFEPFLYSRNGNVPLLIARSDPNYFTPLLSEDGLERALSTASRLRGAMEILNGNSKPQRPRGDAMAREAFANGKSLRIIGIHRFSRAIMLLCRSLEHELSCPVNTNMYLTPGETGARALDRHYDTHDVFVLQIYGRKRWRLYDSHVDSPLEHFPPIRGERKGRTRQQNEKKKEKSRRDTCKLIDEFVLTAGDLLFIPRGYWHEAEGVDGHTSCHLTVGIQSFTYLDLMTLAIAQAAAQDVELRQSLPAGFGTYADCRSAVAEQVSRIMERLPRTISTQSALSQVSEIFMRTREPFGRNVLEPPLNNYYADSVELESAVRVRAGLICRVFSTETEVSIKFGFTTVTLPQAFEAALRFVASKRRFVGKELPGDISDVERISLVHRLMVDGLLTSPEGQSTKIVRKGEELRGWLPTSLDLRPRKSAVEWLYIGSGSLSEPFFNQTVKRLKAADVPARSKITGLKALSSLQDEILPSGFIFHVSRCGSTLLANALRTVPGCVVISEGQPFGAVFAPRPVDSPRTDMSEAKREDLLKGLVRAYGQRRIPEDNGLVIKFSSWDILSLSTVRRLWPEVPIVILIRDPIEVMVSCIKSPPGWMRLKQAPGTASRTFGWDEASVVEMTDEQFCARGIAEFFRAGIASVGPRCKVISYENLRPSRAQEVAKFFGLDWNHQSEGRMSAVFATYAKDADGTKQFVDDREQKQSAATELMRAECKQWADEGYSLLKSQENWQS
jgi:ribosomal protein L16 Arg81 hydroxylase